MNDILYVDDEASNLVVFESAFEDEYDVHVASSGAEALEVLRSESIQLVITDMRMPGMSGVELLEAMVPDFPDVTRMVLTGYMDIEAAIRSINSGRVYRYITKPWDERELRVIINQALERSAAIMKQRALLRTLDEEVQKEDTLRNIFQRYVPPSVVEEILDRSEGEFDASGELRDITLLFSDIRGFTTLCAELEPKQVLELMNEYFSRMTEIIFAHDGAVSHFLGDGLFALFGAPLRTTDTERKAVRAALDMVSQLAEFNDSCASRIVGRDLTIGIGIHAGEVAVGNVGSQDKLDYATVGHPVHELWDVEACTKGHANAILVSSAVRNALDEDFELELFGDARLGISAAPTEIFRVTSGPR